MGITVILLIVSAAVIHTLWNLLSKQSRPDAGFFLIANTTGAVVLLPLAMLRVDVLMAFPSEVWLLGVATGIFMAGYYAALAAAYRRGDLSLVYPIARAAPAVMVVGVCALLGHDSGIGIGCAVGVALILAGAILVPMNAFREWRLSVYFDAVFVLALLVAVCTTGYSMIDDAALSRLRHAPDVTGDLITRTLLYAFLETAFGSLWLLLFVVLHPPSRSECRVRFRSAIRPGIVAGIGIIVGYSLVLVAMAVANNIATIVAFRQISIPLGAALGVVVLREPGGLPKFVGIALLVVGLIFVAIG